MRNFLKLCIVVLLTNVFLSTNAISANQKVMIEVRLSENDVFPVNQTHRGEFVGQIQAGLPEHLSVYDALNQFFDLPKVKNFILRKYGLSSITEILPERVDLMRGNTIVATAFDFKLQNTKVAETNLPTHSKMRVYIQFVEVGD